MLVKSVFYCYSCGPLTWLGGYLGSYSNLQVRIIISDASIQHGTKRTLLARLLYRPSIAAPRRDPRSEADRFLREFESTYGTTHPTFFSEGGYTQALTAAKNQLKYLL